MGKEELKELRAIKKLLMFSLIRAGATSGDLGVVLGVDGSTIRGIIPIKKLRKSASQTKD